VLVVAGYAQACVCANEPIEARLDRADAAVVGKIVGEREGSVGGIAQRVFTVEVSQRVKGDLPKEIIVRSPLGTDCDLLTPKRESVGLLLTRAPDGVLVGTACSVVAPGALVVVGGEPQGGVIKVVVGLLILGLVLLWARRRKRRGTRPNLPGAPMP
jgi:LPXTG-motif cell wall-anchored protein